LPAAADARPAASNGRHGRSFLEDRRDCGKRSAMVDHRVAVTISAMPMPQPPKQEPRSAFQSVAAAGLLQSDIHFFKRGTKSCQRFLRPHLAAAIDAISSSTSLVSLTIFIVVARRHGAGMSRASRPDRERCRHLGDCNSPFVDQQGGPMNGPASASPPAHQLRDRVRPPRPGLSGIARTPAHELAAEGTDQ